MGRPTNKTPPRYSPYKRRSPLGIISRKISGIVSSAVAFSGGLRRSFSKALLYNTEQQNFKSLPLEILFQLFDIASPDDLVRFCSVNRTHMNNVIAYINSEHFAKRLKDMLISTKNSSILSEKTDFPPSAFAQLIRTCHLFQNKGLKTERLCMRFVNKLYLKIGSLQPDHNNEYWGELFSKISWDWSQLDFYVFMRTFTETTGLFARIERFLYDMEPDKLEELALRRLLRALFLDNCIKATNNNTFGGVIHQTQEVPFRLAAILHLFASEESMAPRLMLLLGAPISVHVVDPNAGDDAAQNPLLPGQEFVDYHQIVAEPIHDHQSAQTYLGDLPNFVVQLLRTSTLDMEALHWSELEVFNFMELLTTYPEPWVLRNFASFLVMAPELIRISVHIRASYGDPMEAGNTLFSCVEASILLGFNTQNTLRDTLSALASKLPVAICLTVLKEAVSTTSNLIMETIGTNEFGLVDADELDVINLKTALEAGRHIADLFVSHLPQLNF